MVGLVLLAELVLVVGTWVFRDEAALARAQPTPEGITNAEALGLVLYTDYVHFFQIAGMILLLAMVGAIVLTLREREGVKRQDIATQVNRRREDSVEVVKVRSREGI